MLDSNRGKKMDNEKRADLFLSAYKAQMQRYSDTQKIEWQANFGVWTLLAGSIYFVAQHPIHPPWCINALACVGTVVAHGWWLHKIHKSEEFDKNLWARYRLEGLLLLREPPKSEEDEKPSKRDWRNSVSWLAAELWLTCVLS